jgi:hypothetical protein
MEEQEQTKFDALYIEPYILNRYYSIMAYKHIIENISDYINTSKGDIASYYQADTTTIKL